MKKIMQQLISKSAICLSIISLIGMSHVAANTIHVVEKGDTIYSLARKYGLSEQELMNLNGLTSSRIDLGDQLIVSKQTEDSTDNQGTAGYYVVQKGDTLYSIANHFGLSVDQLRAINGISGNFIDVGDRLALSGSNQPSQPPVVSDDPATYVVQKGDSLYKIANAYGLTVSQLKALNGLTSDFLNVGDLLAVADGGTTSVSPGVSNQGSSNQGSYVVNKGDSLYTIALAYGVTVDQLVAWNGLVSDLIYPGDQLAVTANGTSHVTQPTQLATPSQPNISSNAYTIVPGDNFDTIAQAYGMTGRQLMAFNGRTDTMIYPGEVIYLPDSGTINVPNQPTPSTETSGNATSVTTTPAVDHEKPKSPDKEPREVNIRKPKSLQKDKEELADPRTKAIDPETIELPTHEVAEGEKLAEIAKDNDISEKDLRKWNGLLNDEIKAGDILYLKDPSQAITFFKQARPLKDIYPVKHTVKKDEKIQDLLEIYPVTEAEIMEWSKLEEGKAIEEGTELTLSHPEKAPEIYTVTEEDSLDSIAREYEVSVEALRAWNGLLDNVVYIGEELAVSNPWAQYHQVAPGETLEVLADKYEVSIDQLREWNKLPAESMVVNGVLIVSDPQAFEEKEDSEKTSSSESTTETSSEVEETSAE
ncbi:LysM peptidoglycan-binding domain-containing protein [Facklamia miroungae]|uniref:LysM repeat-containing protein n=1 Tax=Facklamia miroungae TaxID=120956 RepID=A0A1G7S0M5_9LACT|nr:LysM peptidoglycan-binding domain-containing protein [Facklamia miroungae]NKZ29223.1 LysM peptidoglycan-binding domain-containing protein [Facklamia miroungae]SDG16009.1 LysM repeat-containing protein [Facklamia miroungae]